eukprot:gene3246-biopygen1871
MRVSEATKAWGTWNVSVKSLSSAAPRRSAPPRRNVAQPQCAAAAPQLCCSCAAAVLQLRCGCAAAALRLCCSCAAAVLQLRCCCAAAALLLCCSFRADTNERVPPREYQRGDGPELVYQGGRRHSRGGPAWRPSGGVGQRRAPNVGEECPPAAPSGSSLALRWVRRQKARLTSEVTPRRGGGPARLLQLRCVGAAAALRLHCSGTAVAAPNEVRNKSEESPEKLIKLEDCSGKIPKKVPRRSALQLNSGCTAAALQLQLRMKSGKVRSRSALQLNSGCTAAAPQLQLALRVRCRCAAAALRVRCGCAAAALPLRCGCAAAAAGAAAVRLRSSTCSGHPEISSRSIPRFSQGVPKVFPRVSKVSKVFPRGSQVFPRSSEVIPRFCQLCPVSLCLPLAGPLPGLGPNVPRNYAKVFPRFPKFFQGFTGFRSSGAPSDSKVSPTFSQGLPKVLPRFSQRCRCLAALQLRCGSKAAALRLRRGCTALRVRCGCAAAVLRVRCSAAQPRFNRGATAEAAIKGRRTTVTSLTRVALAHDRHELDPGRAGARPSRA